MKAWHNKISILLILISLVYVGYLTYISSNKLLVGTTLEKNKANEAVITNIEEFSIAYDSGVQKGDVIKSINNHKLTSSFDVQKNDLSHS
ncbi:PDZ domain-containing protein, partial [Bacillus atrophaeus]|uniref:PDZ domain-containing protein n=1 Tax=Bacillus atrophaeus TaxID=1452 RepID=UPI002281E6BD